MPSLREIRFLAARRICQVSLLLLFAGGSLFGWKLLRGNLSTSMVLGKVTLTDPFAVLQIAAGGHVVSAGALLGALIVALFFGVIAGRAFCSWVCPVNMVADLASWLRTKAGLGAPGEAMAPGRGARYWAAATCLVVSFFAGFAAFEWISPISMFHRGVVFGMGMGWTVVLAVFLFDLLVLRDGFCGHLCPLGGFYSLITRFRLVRVRHVRENCTLCMKCLEICPERQVLPMIGRASGAVVSGECTNCGRCVEVCGDHAMKFGLGAGTA